MHWLVIAGLCLVAFVMDSKKTETKPTDPTPEINPPVPTPESEKKETKKNEGNA